MEELHFDAIGVEGCPCFVCGVAPERFQDCLVAYAPNDPRKIITLFNIAGAKDCSISRERYILIGGCKQHGQNLRLLARLIGPSFVCVEAIQLAISPSAGAKSPLAISLVRAVKAHEQEVAAAHLRYSAAQESDRQLAASEFHDAKKRAAQAFTFAFLDGPLNYTEIESADDLFQSMSESLVTSD